VTKREAEEDWGREDGGEAERPEKSPGLAAGAHSREEIRSIEHEGIIREVLGGQLRWVRHHFEWINLNRRRAGNTLRA
jgi:hypothetical protein